MKNNDLVPDYDLCAHVENVTYIREQVHVQDTDNQVHDDVDDSDLEHSDSTFFKTKRKKYSVIFREEWIKEFFWLKKDDKIKQGKKCTYCNIGITGGRKHLERHNNSESHKEVMNTAKKTISIKNFTKENKDPVQELTKKLEISLSLFVAEHNLPFTVLDHLNLLLKSNIPDSKIVKKICINRKKGQKVIKHLIAEENLDEIRQLTQNQYYSLVLDESTDITTSKSMAIIIRVYNKKCWDKFLGLIPVIDCTAQSLFDKLTDFLQIKSIPLENMLAFTADNCSVMMGQFNGVQAKLKEKIPNLFVLGCVSHNLNIISERAFKVFPEKIGSLLQKINHHFCNSVSRKAQFFELQEYFGQEMRVILRYNATRWLSRQVNAYILS